MYIDEKYHHATDPSIRPKPKDGTNVAVVVNENEMNNAVSPAPAATAPNSRSNTLKSSGGGGGADNYGKDIKDIPRSTWKLLTNKVMSYVLSLKIKTGIFLMPSSKRF